jgi:hypothetical protein
MQQRRLIELWMFWLFVSSPLLAVVYLYVAHQQAVSNDKFKEEQRRRFDEIIRSLPGGEDNTQTR